jgi:hypothetical protein
MADAIQSLMNEVVDATIAVGRSGKSRCQKWQEQVSKAEMHALDLEKGSPSLTRTCPRNLSSRAICIPTRSARNSDHRAKPFPSV